MRRFNPFYGVVGLAIASLSAGAASAGSISTPILLLSNNTNQVLCIASNVSASSVTVTVNIRGVVSGGASDTCTLTPADRGGCQVPFAGAGQCRITMSGVTSDVVRERVRGVMFTRSTSGPFAIEAVVQAQ